MNRRSFLESLAAPVLLGAADDADIPVDFRYAPQSGQTAICFPDDSAKSLVGERGDLRYGHPGRLKGIDYFTLRLEFGLAGMGALAVHSQRLEAPGVPIVHTRLDHEAVFVELTAFASNLPGEGRVDNVLIELRPRTRDGAHAAAHLTLRTREQVTVAKDEVAAGLNILADAPLRLVDMGSHYRLQFPPAELPARFFIRIAQGGQNVSSLREGVRDPGRILEHARSYWRQWRAFGPAISWTAPGAHGRFLVACARNIQQAREVHDGRLTFQVGPTVYRGLWVVDGNFLLEAARYLGYDKEAAEGLQATWARQENDGAIFAGGGREHWKDTGIAMFSLVRQAELSQDWTYFRAMVPNILRGVEFLKSLREQARTEGSANGRYGLLARGMGDGGLGGVRPEFTNTLWALAGLQAVTRAAARLGIRELDPAARFQGELRDAAFLAMRQEMRRHPAGFEYLPMLMKEDPQWSAADPWDRPRPQVAQWALSHCIYPGLLFEKSDPVVKGHIALMKACTEEDIPAETGWLPHEGVWTYNASFVAHAYLWAGETDWARRTFTGFLNHATPLYCWREEQPLRGSSLASYVGDMPHNWASAECVRYLRHMLALEDEGTLRLASGVGRLELAGMTGYELDGSPTRFGRVHLKLEPDGNRAWRLRFERGAGPAPQRVELPRLLAGAFTYGTVEGARVRPEGDVLTVDPSAVKWSVSWKRGS